MGREIAARSGLMHPATRHSADTLAEETCYRNRGYACTPVFAASPYGPMSLFRRTTNFLSPSNLQGYEKLSMIYIMQPGGISNNTTVVRVHLRATCILSPHVSCNNLQSQDFALPLSLSSARRFTTRLLTLPAQKDTSVPAPSQQATVLRSPIHGTSSPQNGLREE